MRSVTTLLRGGAAAVAVIGTVAALSAATKGPDAGGYTASDATPYSFVDLTQTGGASVLATVDDGLAALVTPFRFKFYGQQYGTLCASSNGAVYFVASADACSGFFDFANTDLTSTTTPNDFAAVLPFWSDLTFQTPGAGSVLYQTLGSTGSRRFVVQWNNAFPQNSPNPVTFQVVLFEGSNRILVQYQTVNLGPANAASSGAHATIGIRNTGAPGNNQGIEWSFDSAVLSDQSAILFSPPVAGDVNTDGIVNCTDMAIVKAAFGKRAGQPGFDPRADVNGDGLVSIIDATIVSRAMPAAMKCP